MFKVYMAIAVLSFDLRLALVLWVLPDKGGDTNCAEVALVSGFVSAVDATVVDAVAVMAVSAGTGVWVGVAIGFAISFVAGLTAVALAGSIVAGDCFAGSAGLVIVGAATAGIAAGLIAGAGV